MIFKNRINFNCTCFGFLLCSLTMLGFPYTFVLSCYTRLVPCLLHFLYTRLVRSSCTLVLYLVLSFTLLVHSSCTLVLYTRLVHLSCTVVLYSCFVHLSCTLVLYTRLVHLSCKMYTVL